MVGNDFQTNCRLSNSSAIIRHIHTTWEEEVSFRCKRQFDLHTTQNDRVDKCTQSGCVGGGRIDRSRPVLICEPGQTKSGIKFVDNEYSGGTTRQMGLQLGSVSVAPRHNFFIANRSILIWFNNFSNCSREPASLVRPLKENANPTQENEYNTKLEAAKPKAVRHLILIRHGQYNLKGAIDAERYLTEMGRKQAAFTGDRLKQLNVPLDVMVRSTMTRAQETGKIISTHIANIPIENCSLIEEGAPIAPQPPIGHWTPEPSVNIPFSWRKRLDSQTIYSRAFFLFLI